MLRDMGMLHTGGHFSLPVSGRHGTTRINKEVIHRNRIAMFSLARMIAKEFIAAEPEGVIGPMNIGKLIADWVTDNLILMTGKSVESLAAIKKSGGRAFSLDEPTRKLVHKRRLLLVDDIVNTGESARRTIDAILEYGGNIVGFGVLFNHCVWNSAHLADVPKFVALAHVELDSWAPPACPSCADGVPLKEL
ncbi:MAG: hypothetical protein HY435_02685 [Candidatus Liptonbacteria bacterium]|nr:hypothetical protein [Candidatus Liptonbacteria bacterium]